MFFKIPVEQAPVQPDILFAIGTFPITNAMMTGAFVTVLLLVFFFFIKQRISLKPGRIQAAVEILISGMTELVEQITGKRETAERVLPLIGALFLFLGISNMITLFPGIGSFTYKGVSMFRTPTNDFNLTLSIALSMVVLTQWASMRVFGPLRHIGKYIKIKEIYQGFRQNFGAGMFAIVDFCIGLLDIISEFAKVISLSLRLFGNMFAGEVIAGILLGSFALLIPVPWLAMNFFVAILQAVVFGSLTAAYYTLAVDDGSSSEASP